jgi:prepilin-type N-terminal cleavage/methylation domain-containing protein
MTDRIKRLKVGRGQAGFTLIELLVVITILGILAAIVVFSVGGINDKGETSACKTDTTTLQTAEEANFAKGSATNGVPAGVYVSEAQLKTAGLLNDVSGLHNITRADGSAITVTTGVPDYKVTNEPTPPSGKACTDAA